MKNRIVLPPYVPEKFQQQFAEFSVAQIVQQLLVAHGATIGEAHRILGFVAIQCAKQLREPSAVADIGDRFMEAYGAQTDQHFQRLSRDPVAQVRDTARNVISAKLAVRVDLKREVEFNIPEELFINGMPSSTAVERDDPTPSSN